MRIPAHIYADKEHTITIPIATFTGKDWTILLSKNLSSDI